MAKKIYLVDANNLIYRMFFALPEFSRSDGMIVNAIFGVAKFMVETLVKNSPDYLYFVKDAKGDNFRHELYSEYKATRERMPDNLRSQISEMERMIRLMDIDIIEIPGFEADDVIGTLANDLGKDDNNDVYVLSSDKDLHSLVNENVHIYDLMKRKIFTPAKTKEKFGVSPEYIIDYLAIVGDKSDNIPGIEGFGPKKAVDLINTIGGIDKIYDVVDSGNFDGVDDSVKKYFTGKTFEKLVNSRDNAFLSKKLATIDLSVPLPDLESNDYTFVAKNMINSEVINFFKEYEFNSLIGEEKLPESEKWADKSLQVKTVTNKNQLDELYKLITNKENITLDTETTSLDVIEAELVGISFYLDDKNIFYINRLHEGESLPDKELKEFLKNVFKLDLTIIGHNLKYDLQILELFLKSDKITKSSDDFCGQMSIGI